MYPMPSDPVPEWLVKFAASRQPKGYKPRPPKSVTKQNQTEWFQQARQNVNRWNRDQANKTWLNQFAESAKKQREELQAKPKETSQYIYCNRGIL